MGLPVMARPSSMSIRYPLMVIGLSADLQLTQTLRVIIDAPLCGGHGSDEAAVAACLFDGTILNVP